MRNNGINLVININYILFNLQLDSDLYKLKSAKNWQFLNLELAVFKSEFPSFAVVVKLSNKDRKKLEIVNNMTEKGHHLSIRFFLMLKTLCVVSFIKQKLTTVSSFTGLPKMTFLFLFFLDRIKLEKALYKITSFYKQTKPKLDFKTISKFKQSCFNPIL